VFLLPQELILSREYQMLLGALKERIRSAQLQALRYVNREQIDLYSDIGRMIVEKQQGDTWGKNIVGNLAEDLGREFPGANGLSAANLWRMRNFYEAYGQDQELAQLVREIGWSHNITIPGEMQRRPGAGVLHSQLQKARLESRRARSPN
jgi:predicted nuclease of restriction endonuclease-like (RecB) superfamily